MVHEPGELSVQVGVVDETQTRALRRAVLRPHLGPDEPLPGDDLPGVVHIGAVDENGTVLGTCFVYADPCPWLPDVPNAWHLRQMATADGHRRHGVGAVVLAAAADYVRGAGASLLWCNARETAGAFYAGHGFLVHGEVFTDAQHLIPHLRMWRELPGRPASS